MRQAYDYFYLLVQSKAYVLGRVRKVSRLLPLIFLRCVCRRSHVNLRDQK